MPHHDDNPASLPPAGSSSEEMLRTVLPMVARSAAESAKAATLAATSITSNEVSLSEVRDALREQVGALEGLKKVVETTAMALSTEKQDQGQYFRRLLSPELFAQIVLNILLILATLFGVQSMMVPTGNPQAQIQEVSPNVQP